LKIFFIDKFIIIKKNSSIINNMQGISTSKSPVRNWLGQVFGQAPLHHLGDFLDRYDFAALQTTSATMQTSLRNVIRARNEELPVEKRMANLEGAFTVWEVYKKLLKCEGRQPDDIIATGGYVVEQTVNTVMNLDLVTKQYTTLAPMTTARMYHASAVLDNKLYVMGGIMGGNNNDGFTSVVSVECLDLETGQWSEVAPMSAPRDSHGAAVLGGNIYMAGGTPVETLVERFDPDTNQWKAVTPMNTPRTTHGLVSADGKLFAVGGYNRFGQALSSVECFDPKTGEWTNIADLSIPRYELAVVVLGNMLYAIGGNDSQNERQSSVECLNLSVPNSEWTAVDPMITPRASMEAVVTGGKIYIAGVHGSSNVSSCIECFDPSDGPLGRWTVISESSEFETRSTISSL
jgi:hypothetical protein